MEFANAALVQSEVELVDAHDGFQAALATLADATGVLELPPRL